ncbi:hypothetical protein HYH03_010530 [Edaphochlamys debaryana]|uniref:Uncharacterized protein n=1 Tax=Edaphochlamys debaryana TaxID=47281 RepID=A0A835XVS8_9CHLO|nr:hypothetical protein HYH03_010530 [Edaphochlamys debaryana]|eukprot:KAG2491086.1 hypothetical protein HYH03_010530 [Edaphochlamys debaryana]
MKLYVPVAVASTYATRLSAPVWRTLQGPSYHFKEGMKYFVGATAYDLVLFLSLLGIWRVRPRLELAAASCLALCLGLMAHWHRDGLPPGDELLGPKVLLLRLAAGLGYVALARALQRGGPRGGSTGDGRGADASARAQGRPSVSSKAGSGAADHGPGPAPSAAADRALEAYLEASRGPLSADVLSYRSPIERRTLRFKIPDAEPEQLAPGYRERLREHLRGAGVEPSGVCVRPGCVRLMVVTSALRRQAVQPATDPRKGAADRAAEEQPQPPPRFSLDAPTVVQALGLEAPEGFTGGHDQWLSAVRCHAPEVLGSEARDWMALGPARIDQLSAWALHVPGPAAGAREWAAPELRVVLACPRRGQRGSSEGAEAGAAAAAGLGAEALPLTACLSWGNTSLPVRVTPVGDVAAAEGGEGQQMVEYALQLPCQPPCPGVVLLELSVGDPDAADGSGQPVPGARTHTTLPLLATDDAAVAAEVAALAECWPRGDTSSLTDLLLDMGTWAAGPPELRAAAGGPGVSLTAGIWLAAAEGVMAFAESMECYGVTARIRSDIAAHQARQTAAVQEPGPSGTAQEVAEPSCGAAPSDQCVGAAEAAVELPPSSSRSSSSRSTSSSGSTGLRLQPPARRTHATQRSRTLREWLTAAAWVARTEAGLWSADRAPSGAELEAFRAGVIAWRVSLGRYLGVVECFGFLAILLRAGRGMVWYLPVSLGVSLVPGLLIAAAPRLCAPASLERLRQAMRPLRVLLPALAKALCAPSVQLLRRAQSQLPLLALFNGLLLPLADLITLRTLALVSLVRLPLNAWFLVGSGVSARPAHAALVAALVEALALTTTLLCQTHVRLCERHALPASLPVAAAGATSAVSVAAGSAGAEPAQGKGAAKAGRNQHAQPGASKGKME